MPSLYEDLGVGPHATEAEIRAAHRRRVKDTHPDAGGDEQEFHAVQRAYSVLTDQSKRAKYDESGRVDDRPENIEEASAMTILAAKFTAIISDENLDPRYVDIPRAIKRLLTADMEGGRQALAQCQREILRLEEYARRLKAKPGKADTLRTVLEQHIAGQKDRQEVGDRAMRACEIALALADHYEYLMEVQQQVSYVRGPYGGGGSGTQWFTPPGV